MSLASITSQQNAAIAAANAAAAASVSTASAATTSANSAAQTAASTGNAALSSLSGNFGDFLGMLMTQLQNQDPTSPLDTNQFTSELVQFSGVEQQINTNTSLTQLIQLTQAGEVMQSSSMVGKQVTVTSTQMPLQNSQGTVNFTAPAAEPVAIAIYDSTGARICDATVSATAGSNTWTWNGANGSGQTVPDGAYTVAVEGVDTTGTTTALPFTVTGTATGVQNTSAGVQLQMGALSVNFSAVTSVGN
jgi:flagellar basal-body rod modification protein FlgD